MRNANRPAYRVIKEKSATICMGGNEGNLWIVGNKAIARWQRFD